MRPMEKLSTPHTQQGHASHSWSGAGPRHAWLRPVIVELLRLLMRAPLPFALYSLRQPQIARNPLAVLYICLAVRSTQVLLLREYHHLSHECAQHYPSKGVPGWP